MLLKLVIIIIRVATRVFDISPIGDQIAVDFNNADLVPRFPRARAGEMWGRVSRSDIDC